MKKLLSNCKVKLMLAGNSALMIILIILYYLQYATQCTQAFICR